MAGKKGRCRESQAEVSLFPFLAVLICTMGMLVMLLVLMSDSSSDNALAQLRDKKDQANLQSQKLPTDAPAGQKDLNDPSRDPLSEIDKKNFDKSDQGKDSNDSPAGRKIAGNKSIENKTKKISPELQKEYLRCRNHFKNFPLDQLREETESSGWFLEELTTLKKRTEATLTQERDRLSSIEKVLSDRVKEFRELRTAVDLLQNKPSDKKSEDLLKKEAADKKAELVRLAESVAQLKEKQKQAKPVYSVVPYQGKSGTKRYPIYIECNKNGVFLMPEGVPFAPEDFLLGKYPGNPFDSGLRAARQCILNKTPDEGLEKEPYPLLIVRPGGEQAYYAAVYALASWGGEYGYELVDEDWELNYPEPDRQAETQIRLQVQTARAQLAVPLAAILASAQKNGDLARYRKEMSGADSFSDMNNSSVSENGFETASIQSQLGNGVRLAPVGGSASNDSTAMKTGTGSVISPGSGSFVSGGSNLTVSGGSGSDLAINTAGTADPFAEAQPLPAYAGAFSSKSRTGSAAAYPSGSSGPNQLSLAGESNAGIGITAASQNIGQNGPYPYLNDFSNKNNANGQNGSASAGGSFAVSGQTGLTSTSGQTGLTSADGPNAIEGSAVNGAPIDSSKQLLSMVQQTEAPPVNSRAADMTSVKGGWEQVGNTTYSQSGTGTSSTGSTSSALSSASGEGAGMPGPSLNRSKNKNDPSKEEDKTPGYASSQSAIPGKAINLNEEMRKPVNASVERPISIECRTDAIVFPKQPGLRFPYTASTAAMNTGKVEKDLLETTVLCIKGWGAAGRNMYWIPWISVKVAPGGEQNFERVKNLYQKQGITVKRDTSG